ncbi:restriction endonuclease subunit S [Winogradskyella rapida]|uniref:Restriction endonuclease subunit S n=1 Tax=Winogradskyella rapida TaxID=549701 RepID=A0ABW3KLK5_9FLAO
MSSVEDKLPEGWMETTFGEQYLDVLNGYAFKSKDFATRKIDENYLPVLKIKNVANGDANHNDVVFHLVEEKFEKYRIKEKDILIALTGNHPFAKTQVVGGVSRYKMKLDSLLNQRVAKLKAGNNELLNDDFIYNFFKWNETQFYIGNQSSGSASQANISKNDILNIPLNLPPIQEQKAIAKVLTAFDDKIENLRAQNQTLEQTAQTVFKEWFGKYQIDDELPEGWRVGKLGEEFDISIGRTPPRKQTQWFSDKPIGKKWVSIKDIGNSGIYIDTTSEYLTDQAIDKFNIPVIPENTTILSFKMTVGKLTITTEEMLSNEAIAHLKLKDGTCLTSEFIYLYLQNLDFNALGSTSSIVTAINSTMIKNLDFVIPNEEKLKDFESIVNSIFKKIKNNSKQIQTLTKTRDALLPKLMRGDIRVNGFKK